jgi:hypothetical protein
MRIKYSYTIALLIGMVCCRLSAFSQVTVTGPTCVVPGTVYQYVIVGLWDSASTMQVCLTNGVMAGSGTACTPNGAPLSFVLVTWNGAGNGTLQVNSSGGSATLAVTLTDTLTGGLVQDTTKAQRIAFLSLPALVRCSASTGGACSPSYSYQWEQSPDMVEWSAIPGATGQNLLMTQQLRQTIFVRRKVTETNSNSIAYSGAALVDVGPPASSALAL